MTVYRSAGRVTFRYDFWFQNRRYVGNTLQTNREDAQRVENKIREQLRHKAAGIYIPSRDDRPTFRDWAEVFLAYKQKRLEPRSLQHLRDILPVALRFWGSPDEEVEPTPAKPFHNLRLCDPIDDPDWILKFEDWLAARGLSNQSKNHYRGLLRRMYAVALLPEYRKVSGVAVNPFVGVPNDPTMPRDVTVTPEELRRWIEHASYHIRLAVAIGALASKLRERNILELQWSHIEPDPRATTFNPRLQYFIKVRRHKTARRTRRPLVAPVSRQLLRILRNAWERGPSSEYVVTYHGQPVYDITGGVRAAVESAGLIYGRDVRDADGHPIGVTFHTLRHTATTLMSDQLADPLKLMDAAGHTDISTTLRYRHARPSHQKPAAEQLSRTLKIEDLVTRPQTRGARKRQ